MLKIEENKMHFFFDFGSRWVLPKFSGAPWDPVEPPGVPEEELKSEFNRKVARNNGLGNFPVEL